MRLARIRIENYRCFDDQEIEIDNYSCLVGPNGSGKSTVLMALNVFFRNTQAPSDVLSLRDEDFHRRDTSKPIKITCKFDQLSSSAKDDLKAYVRQNELTISAVAVWNADLARAEVQQFGVRQVMKDFAPYFEANDAGAKAADLKAIYTSIAARYPDLPDVKVKDAMLGALREFEESNPDLCEPIESSDQFYGWSKGSNLIAKYIQWVYLPAVKDATEEQDEQRNSALGTLLQRGVRSQVDFSEPLEELRQRTTEEYRRLIENQNKVLAGLAENIEKQLKNWAHVGARVELNWHFDDQKSISVAQPFARAKVGEGGFLGEITRSGHGMQRSFLVAILQVLATLDAEEQPTLLLGFEEPELYQHPPQARHLAALLEQLSSRDAQVVVTTHSPYFVSSHGYESVRLVTKAGGAVGAAVSQCRYQDLCELLSSALEEVPQKPSELIAAISVIMQPSHTELFFCNVPILVEGPEDVAFFSTWLKYRGTWDEFRRLGCHFIVCEGKTNMSRPLAIARALNLPVFTIFDGDCDKMTDQLKDEHYRDNKCILHLVDANSDPRIEESLYGENFVMWRTRILDEMQLAIGTDAWNEAENGARKSYQLQSGVRRKNPVLLAATVESILDAELDLRPLEVAGNSLLKFARAVNM